MVARKITSADTWEATGNVPRKIKDSVSKEDCSDRTRYIFLKTCAAIHLSSLGGA
jgi:hypothetical protein